MAHPSKAIQTCVKVIYLKKEAPHIEEKKRFEIFSAQNSLWLLIRLFLASTPSSDDSNIGRWEVAREEIVEYDGSVGEQRSKEGMEVILIDQETRSQGILIIEEPVVYC